MRPPRTTSALTTSQRRPLAVLLAVTAALATGCSHPRPASADPTARVVQNGVEVSVVLTGDTIRATYRPQDPGFHLYSISLPADGVDGVGVPTRLAVQGGLHATGAPTADRTVQLLNEEGLDAPVPVYPDGPVTVTLPVSRTGDGSATTQVVVDYGACSTRTCLLPVTGLAIPLRLN